MTNEAANTRQQLPAQAGLILIFIAAVIVMLLMNELQKHFGLSETAINILGFLSYIVPTGVVLKIQGWRPQPVPPGCIVSSVFFTFGALALTFIFSRYWMEWARDFDPTGDVLGQMMPLTPPSKTSIMNNIFVIFLAPVAEEVVFRYGMLQSFSRFMSKGSALLLTSVAFAAGHLHGYSAIQLMPVFVFGLLAGITYLTAGLGFSILLHAVVNAWPYVKENLYNSDAFLLMLALLFISGLFVFMFQLVRLRKSVFS